MGDNSGIEWTDTTWNPTTGCDKVSPGCDHCYAMTLAKRLKAMGSPAYQQDGDPKTSGPGFAFQMHPERLDQPIRWTRPRKIFVNSMSDLFHGGMSLDFLAKVWAVMSIAKQHTFQVLTKRPQIARSVFTGNVEPYPGASMPFKMLVDSERMQMGYPVLPDSRRDDGTYAWPLPNVWLGTSVEDQKRADLRIHHLLETPAAVRFLSCEPLLGPVDTGLNAHNGTPPLIDWIIVGGESGGAARPMHPDWARSLRDQAVEHGAAFHFKQWGEWIPALQQYSREPVDVGRTQAYRWPPENGTPGPLSLRVGKKAAGRLLDGRTWDESPGGDQ